MNIKEVEARTGMTRANIRFYEAEGLIDPTRRENGYRDYAEEDVTALMRIRLLRALRVPLEEIRSLQRGETTLSDALAQQLDALGGEQTALERSAAVCRAIQADGEAFETLDARRWLDALAAPSMPAVPSTDAIQEQPWRRFWARCFDMTLYGLLVLSAAALIFHAYSAVGGVTTLQKILFWALPLVVLILVEPIFLSRLGTTPGKWILGVRVTDHEGGLLSHSAAYQRTVDMLQHGMAFNIPLIRLYCLFRSYRRCDLGESLLWENDSVVTVRDMKKSRYIVLAAAYAAVIGLMALALLLSWQMPNRGELTVAEFCENYNRAAKLYDADIGFRLASDGAWERTDDSVIYIGQEAEELTPPALHFEERDGFVTGVSFEGGSSLLLGSLESGLACAFAGAQREAGLLYSDVRQIMTELSRMNDSISEDVCGVHIESSITTTKASVPTLTYSSEDMTFGTGEIIQTQRYGSFSMRKAA